MKRFLYAVLGVTLVGLMAIGPADAQGLSITISIDENGVGSFANTNGFFSPLPSGLLPDPGPGGLSAALTYGLLNPPGLTAGDLLILEPTSIVASDLLRFNPTESCFGSPGCLAVYSDQDDPVLALADTGLPSRVNTNVVTVHEVGPEGNNGYTYTPTAGQPGFVTGAGGPVTYVFVSDDTPIPEPASFALMGAALAGLGFAQRRHKVKRQD